MKSSALKILWGVVSGILCIILGFVIPVALMLFGFILWLLGIIAVASLIAMTSARNFPRIWYLWALLFGIASGISMSASSSSVPQNNPLIFGVVSGTIALIAPLALSYWQKSKHSS